MNNYAFIDGQNLHLGTQTDGWELNMARFYIYLKEKYKITTAYYFLGCPSGEYNNLYLEIQKAGFVLQFREHSLNVIGSKKGNVDTDIVFEMMKHLIEQDSTSKLLLVSGDGDYKKTVDYCIKRNQFIKILFPNRRYSSLYKQITATYYDLLSHPHIKQKIEQMKNPGLETRGILWYE